MKDNPQIDAAALMNAIYREFPDYAVKFNLMERSGGDSPLAELLEDVTRPVPAERMVCLTPEAGRDFLRF